MAGGLSYTALESTELSTAEIYGQTLVDLGREHKDIVGLSADLAGSTKIGVFGKEFPDRFFNVGIAEQNMFGIAAGMAKAGLVPFVSTFSTFASLRSSLGELIAQLTAEIKALEGEVKSAKSRMNFQASEGGS